MHKAKANIRRDELFTSKFKKEAELGFVKALKRFHELVNY